MASGKQSPRQKMINLMYLVFIAMLALNMSKEVLTAFGLMNEKLTESNATTTERNNAFLAGLGEKASEEPAKYATVKKNADKVHDISKEFNSYIETLKSELTANVNACDTLGQELAEAMIVDGALDILAKAEEIAFKDEMPERL